MGNRRKFSLLLIKEVTYLDQEGDFTFEIENLFVRAKRFLNQRLSEERAQLIPSISHG